MPLDTSIRALTTSPNGLIAEFQQIDTAFAEQIAKG